MANPAALVESTLNATSSPPRTHGSPLIRRSQNMTSRSPTYISDMKWKSSSTPAQGPIATSRESGIRHFSTPHFRLNPPAPGVAQYPTVMNPIVASNVNRQQRGPCLEGCPPAGMVS
jgi:hypothetical protein